MATPLISIIAQISIQAANSGAGGSQTLSLGTSLVDVSNYAAQVVISSATLNSMCAAAFTAAGGSLS